MIFHQLWFHVISVNLNTNRMKRELHQKNYNPVHMMSGPFYFFSHCKNLKLKATTWTWMWQSLKLPNLSVISWSTFKWVLFKLSSECLNIWRELLFTEWVEDSCLLYSCQRWSDTPHLAKREPCGTQPDSSSQPMNMSSLHRVKRKQIASQGCKRCNQKSPLMGLQPSLFADALFAIFGLKAIVKQSCENCFRWNHSFWSQMQDTIRTHSRFPPRGQRTLLGEKIS